MTGPDIKQIIEEKNEAIRNLTMKNFFTLNDGVSKIMIEIQELQKQCPHEFEDGKCKYCYIKED